MENIYRKNKMEKPFTDKQKIVFKHQSFDVDRNEIFREM